MAVSEYSSLTDTLLRSTLRREREPMTSPQSKEGTIHGVARDGTIGYSD